MVVFMRILCYGEVTLTERDIMKHTGGTYGVDIGNNVTRVLTQEPCLDGNYI